MKTMAMTTYEKGMEQGEIRGQRRSIRVVLEDRFGPLSAAAVAQLDAWPPERLEELLRESREIHPLE